MIDLPKRASFKAGIREKGLKSVKNTKTGSLQLLGNLSRARGNERCGKNSGGLCLWSDIKKPRAFDNSRLVTKKL